MIKKHLPSSIANTIWGSAISFYKGSPPPTPSVRETTIAGESAAIETLPARRVIAAAAKAGKGPGTVTVDGKVIPYDFTDIGDLDLQAVDLEAQGRAARGLAQHALDVQREFSREFALLAEENLKATDPDRYAAQEELGRQMLSELLAGRDLTDQQSRNVEQSVRRAQSARGNVLGPANIAQESLAKFDVGEKLRQQRLANVQSYMHGAPMVSQFSQLQGAQQGAAPFMPQPMQSGLGVNPNAGAQAMQFAAQNYGTQVRGMANQSNPWMTGLGFVGGALGGPMLGTMGRSWGRAATGGVSGPPAGWPQW